MTSFHMMMSCDIKIRCSKDKRLSAKRVEDGEEFDMEEELKQDLNDLEKLVSAIPIPL